MMNLRQFAGVLGLSIALACAGCGQAQTGQASLDVASVPQAEVFVDGVSQGMSGSTLALTPGTHKVEVRLDRFQTYSTEVTLDAAATTSLDTVLMPLDPSDPIVIAKLAESVDVDLAPFVEPRTTRGGSSRRSAATLLWPARDVRQDGLQSYAIEADETYTGDASLEFRHKSKVLYSEAFNPESVTTVRPIPAEVLENVKVGSTIKWGLYFEDRRRPIEVTFKVVQRPKADRQLEKLADNRHMQRQPLITRQIMAATILENNRLYTEALVSNLKIAAEHPSSTQPYRGMVTTLRRLDAEDSELFAFVSPYVSGKGGHAGFSRPGDGVGREALGIAAWSPTQVGTAPGTLAATTGSSAGRSGPSGQGVTPTDSGARAGAPAAQDPATSGSAAEGSTTPGATQRTPQGDEPTAGMRLLSERSAELDAASEEAQKQAAIAQEAAQAAEHHAEGAAQAAEEADAAATAAREAVEQAGEPTQAQQDAMAAAGAAAEEAREAAVLAREAADQAQRQAARDGGNAERAAAAAAAARDVLNQASAGPSAQVPSSDPRADTQAARKEEAARAAAVAEAAQSALQAQEANLVSAESALQSAQAALEAADQARIDNPGEESAAAHEAAQAAFEQASAGAEKARASLESARQAVENMGRQTGQAARGSAKRSK